MTRLQWIFGFFPALKKFWLSRAGSLSGGQKQMVSIARAIVEPRRLLLIDEPTKGLAPAIIGGLIECLREIKRSGVTMLLVEQNFRVARELGDRVRVMDNGRIVHAGADGRTRRRRSVAGPAARPLPGFAPMKRDRFRRGAAAAQTEFLPALTPLIVARSPRPSSGRRRVSHPDGRRPRDGHDDLHDGVGPDARLRHDGRAQFWPRRLHFAGRLCRDARASCRWPRGSQADSWPLNLGAVGLALAAAVVVCGASAMSSNGC